MMMMMMNEWRDGVGVLHRTIPQGALRKRTRFSCGIYCWLTATVVERRSPCVEDRSEAGLSSTNCFIYLFYAPSVCLYLSLALYIYLCVCACVRACVYGLC